MQFQEIERLGRRHVVLGKDPKSTGDDASAPRDVTNVPTLHVGGVGGTRGDDPHVFGQMDVQAHVDLPRVDRPISFDEDRAMIGELELLFPVSLGTEVKHAGRQIGIAAQFVMRGRVDGFLQRKDQMAHERETILDGTDIRLGVGLRDVFDPDVGLHAIRGLPSTL